MIHVSATLLSPHNRTVVPSFRNTTDLSSGAQFTRLFAFIVWFDSLSKAGSVHDRVVHVHPGRGHKIPLIHCVLTPVSSISPVFRPCPFRGFLIPDATSVVPTSMCASHLARLSGSTIMLRAFLLLSSESEQSQHHVFVSRPFTLSITAQHQDHRSQPKQTTLLTRSTLIFCSFIFHGTSLLWYILAALLHALLAFCIRSSKLSRDLPGALKMYPKILKLFEKGSL